MINVNFETDVKLSSKKIIILKKCIKKKFNKIHEEFSFLKKKDIFFSILITTSSSIKKLNYKFRKKRKSTDVLSFPLYKNSKIKKSKQKNFYIGDIALCYEILKLRAKKSNFFYEFDKLWIHGFLHLLGFVHEKNKDYKKMLSLENKILK